MLRATWRWKTLMAEGSLERIMGLHLAADQFVDKMIMG